MPAPTSTRRAKPATPRCTPPRGTDRLRLIQLLVDRGASLEAKNKAGQTPLALTLPRRAQRAVARATGRQQAAEELLRKLGATR